jgi:hypothetical protein
MGLWRGSFGPARWGGPGGFTGTYRSMNSGVDTSMNSGLGASMNSGPQSTIHCRSMAAL